MSDVAGRLDHDGAQIAWRRVEGAGPTVVFLGGFRSDMGGIKGETLADWAATRGRAFVRFDYFGHGESSGAFEDGTISRWRGDVLAVIDQLTHGPLILVGSSMGGWLALLAALARPVRMAGLVLLAPAADFTERLLAPAMDAEDRMALARDGVWMRPTDHGDLQPITRALLDDGAQWSVLPGPIRLGAPTRILQGQADDVVPWRHAMALAGAIEDADLTITLIRDGEHRLSRPADLARLLAAIEEFTA
jgi:pimeloyl-ACP methyl ester carboxylesterase